MLDDLYKPTVCVFSHLTSSPPQKVPKRYVQSLDGWAVSADLKDTWMQPHVVLCVGPGCILYGRCIQVDGSKEGGAHDRRHRSMWILFTCCSNCSREVGPLSMFILSSLHVSSVGTEFKSGLPNE
jgi:hypothetical protein